MGFGSDWTSAPVMAEIERALRAVAAAGNCGGVIALSPEDEDRFGAWGARYFAGVTTGLITQAFRQASAAGGRLEAAGRLSY
jgi:4-hydroxy-2-oxoheptanedioate aldolase